MKYGSELSRRSVPEWRAYNLDYNEIKGLIKKATSSDQNTTVDTVFTALKDQYDAVSFFYYLFFFNTCCYSLLLSLLTFLRLAYLSNPKAVKSTAASVNAKNSSTQLLQKTNRNKNDNKNLTNPPQYPRPLPNLNH